MTVGIMFCAGLIFIYAATLVIWQRPASVLPCREQVYLFFHQTPSQKEFSHSFLAL